MYFGHVLNLAIGESALLSGFRESTRRNIKKAKKEGVDVTICNSLESVAEFFRLNCLTRKMHGLPPQPYRFFKKTYEHIISKGHGIVALASAQGKYIAANVYFNFGSQAIYKYGASDRNYQYLRANNLVMWEAIRYYAERGCKSFCFGRTEPENTGLLQFKRGWGAEERTIYYYKYDISQDIYIKESSKPYGFHKTLFSNTPLALLRLIGSHLYRHIG
jgi:lipid II:glycine glycyltransferase (peptidoglycan interpeptide bridge formation enzyme)